VRNLAGRQACWWPVHWGRGRCRRARPTGLALDAALGANEVRSLTMGQWVGVAADAVMAISVGGEVGDALSASGIGAIAGVPVAVVPVAVVPERRSGDGVVRADPVGCGPVRGTGHAVLHIRSSRLQRPSRHCYSGSRELDARRRAVTSAARAAMMGRLR
jgi:hypothetical protein